MAGNRGCSLRADFQILTNSVFEPSLAFANYAALGVTYQKLYPYVIQRLPIAIVHPLHRLPLTLSADCEVVGCKRIPS